MVEVRKSRRRGEDGRRAELIRAAARVVAKEGVAAATTRRIADEAGVPAGLVHYWFAGKDELLEAVVADTLNSIEAAGVGPAAVAGPQSLFDRLRAAFDAVEQDDPGHQLAMYELTTWALRRPDVRDLARNQYAQYRQVAANAVAAWAREHGVTFADGEETLARFVAVLFDGLTLAWLADPEGADVEAVLRLVADLVERYAAQA